jgi:uncharacterized Zn-binding protein involved in type VI secretion
MSFPAARLFDMTVSGDPITGPGVPTVLIGGLPAAVVGDLVSGPNCVGAVITGSVTVLIGGRQAARVTSQVTGVNPSASGAPASTVIGPPGAPTVLIGG